MLFELPQRYSIQLFISIFKRQLLVVNMLHNYLWISFLFLIVYGRPDIIEEEVLDEILYSYNKLARPGTLENPTVVVKHGLNLIKIVECDGRTLKAETWLEMSWIDPRLVWSLDFFDIKSLSLPSDLMWTPDIVLYNNPSSHAGNGYNPRVFIFNTGSVSWFPPTTITTNCDESENDPKTVFCLMTFGSWSYDGKAVDIQLLYDDIELRDYVENTEWEYVNSTIIRNVKRYPCCPEPYADITYNITIRRRDKPTTSGATVNIPGLTNGVVKNNQTHGNQNTNIEITNTESQNNTLQVTESDTKTKVDSGKTDVKDTADGK